MSSLWYLVYPRNDRSKLTPVEIVDALSYELSDYAVASRQSFDTAEEAHTYGKKLAEQNGLTFVPDDEYEDFLD